MAIKNTGIYAIKSESGMAYIGSSKNITNRKIQHFCALKIGKHHCDQLQKAWKKYKTLRFMILEYCSIDDLIEREQYWMDNHQMKFLGIYNSSLRAGKMLHSSESKAKISKAKTGKTASAETKLKISNARKGRKRSPETVEKIASANRGQKRSLETKRKISESKKGKSFSLGRKYHGKGLLALQESAAKARACKKDKKNGY